MSAGSVVSHGQPAHSKKNTASDGRSTGHGRRATTLTLLLLGRYDFGSGSCDFAGVVDGAAGGAPAANPERPLDGCAIRSIGGAFVPSGLIWVALGGMGSTYSFVYCTSSAEKHRFLQQEHTTSTERRTTSPRGAVGAVQAERLGDRWCAVPSSFSADRVARRQCHSRLWSAARVHRVATLPRSRCARCPPSPCRP